ncbi:MAG TPA: hypothetical protein VJI15_01715 [Candidatus Nanoarchaeia archaeon]|nr:hypothetical protein [Candidatus Nanoarchaeia archaeon]
MGTITINVSDTTETIFREVVREEIGSAKGSLGTAVEEALTLWISKKREEEIATRQLALMKRGFALGKYTFQREELHERQN